MRSLVSLAAALRLSSIDAAFAFRGPSPPAAGWRPAAAFDRRLDPRSRSRGSISPSAVPPRRRRRAPPPPRRAVAEPRTEDDVAREDRPSHNPIKRAYDLYTSYFDRLWSDTDVDRRHKLARQLAVDDVARVRDMVGGDAVGTGAAFAGVDDGVRRRMEEACDAMLAELDGRDSDGGAPVVDRSASASAVVAGGTEPADAPASAPEPPAPSRPDKKKGGRSVLFGAAMGLGVAGWVYSGNYVFTALFTLMTALGQLEYYRMVMQAGIYPARRISVAGACATFLTALFAPDLHQICLPVASTWAMVWFLTKRSSVSTISEIATTFMGMFYLGYIPSFWVRIRQLGGDLLQPTRLAPLVSPLLERLGQKNFPAFLPKTIHFPITSGANFIFWTWLCIAFSDVGGYFAGRRFGRTKLGAISPAAGKTSPNKTVEGVVGGCAFSLVLATLGAWVQDWPYWYALGPVHGVLLALLGLVGDLTASMLKRDAGLKDFGDLIPEHGGIMDRVDSYIFTAPYGWIVCGYVIPWLKGVAGARAAAVALVV